MNCRSQAEVSSFPGGSCTCGSLTSFRPQLFLDSSSKKKKQKTQGLLLLFAIYFLSFFSLHASQTFPFGLSALVIGGDVGYMLQSRTNWKFGFPISRDIMTPIAAVDIYRCLKIRICRSGG
jgi:hypothetical protein